MFSVVVAYLIKLDAAVKRRALITVIPLLSAAIFLLDSFFRKGSRPGAAEFRERVLRVARAEFPGIQFEAPAAGVEVILATGIRVGLQT